ncbi:pig-C [Schizosaccharomyces japonicus yFS275]|uniref:Pig-C n=1 Tax=Schizosaccharomyces japonicus (strain yFS275 / FY16936) TaxID=402676 RepID=B6K5Z3_SCHJY|nr:pig-C [Schizosaccharomyces japonicus yFS275]EEB08947.1 pig-C [Schizosaccharomyces japonicus yFS275]
MKKNCAAPAPKKAVPTFVLSNFTASNNLHHRRPQQPWKKVLWRKQDYPDNYIDESFLNGLQRNVNIQVTDFWSLVADSLPITQHLASIVIFVACFVAIYQNRLSCTVLGVCSNVFAVSAFILWDRVISKPSQSYVFISYRECFKSCLLIVLTLIGLSPILMSLTKSTSPDSIWSVSVWLFLANVFFHEYTVDNKLIRSEHEGQRNRSAFNTRLHNSLSTNASLSASVVLASRLDQSLHVFIFILFAVYWFALFPIFRKYVHMYSFYADMLMTLFMLISAYLATCIVASVAIASVFLLLIFFISFVCPVWFIKLQRFKNEIHGPWDIARPQIGKNKFS